MKIRSKRHRPSFLACRSQRPPLQLTEQLDVIRRLLRGQSLHFERLCSQQAHVRTLSSSSQTESTASDTDAIRTHVAALQVAVSHLADTHERLSEQSHRRNVLVPLGQAMIDLLQLAGRLDMPHMDAEMLTQECRNLLARFSLDTFAPCPGTPFEPKTMVPHARSVFAIEPVVAQLIRAGIICHSSSGASVLCPAVVTVAHATIHHAQGANVPSPQPGHSTDELSYRANGRTC